MRLIITVIVCSLLTVGGFFGYKQYQRAGMKEDARAYVMSAMQRRSQNYDPAHEAQIVEYIDALFNETFSNHYISGGLTKPAEFNDVLFTRDLMERVHDAAVEADIAPEAKDLARELRQYSQPLPPGRMGGPPQDAPDPADDNPGD